MRQTGERAQTYGSVAAANIVGISLRQLYYWIQVLGVVRPRLHQFGTRRFARLTAADVRTLQAVKQFIDDGFTLRAAVRKAAAQTGAHERAR